MQNPLIIGLIVFGVILVGAFLGCVIKVRLPKHHLSDETKSTVTVSMAVVATFSALVLGLLISNGNTSFSALGGEVTTLSAQILRLDQLLRRYGPETGLARETLRQYAELKTADLFPDSPADVRLDDPRAYELLQQLEDSILALKPANSRDKWWLDQAMTLAGKIGDTRWLLTQQVGQGTPKAFVALLVFLVDLIVRQFWSVRPPQSYIGGHPDTLRSSGSRRDRNDPRIGAGFRGTGPYLATANAPSGQCVANRTRSRAVRITCLRTQAVFETKTNMIDAATNVTGHTMSAAELFLLDPAPDRVSYLATLAAQAMTAGRFPLYWSVAGLRSNA